MKILYIAYSCDPYNGSEDQIGWNIPLESAKSGNEVYVITKEEQRNNIEKYCKNNNTYNIKFYYVDINEIYKKVYKNFLYSGRLNIWNKKSYKTAKKLVEEFNIQIIHQLTPVEFRAVGKYGKIQKTKFVVGPLGGGSFVPSTVKYYAKENAHIELIRNMMNKIAIIKYKLNGYLKNVDCILYSNEETMSLLNTLKSGELYTEIGIGDNQLKNFVQIKNNRKFLVAGRLIYIKGHNLLFDALETLPEKYNYEVKIVGDGEMYNQLHSRINSSPKLRKHVKLLGKIPFEKMEELYTECSVLIMPSIRENTGTVIIEALSHGRPVIALNRFGAKLVLDDGNSWLYDGKSKEEVINSLTSAITDVLEDTIKYDEMCLNAYKAACKNTWKNKSDKYIKIYEKIIREE